LESKQWTILWDEEAREDLKRIEKKDAERITNKIEKFLVKDPIALGRKLTGNYKDYYRYRVGSYRVIYSISKSKVTILILQIGKRDEIYN